MQRVLVIGGTGFVGSNLCHKLAYTGLHVTVATRRRENARELLVLPMLDVIETDPHDPRLLEQLVQGHDAVVNLIAILHGAQQDFERVHVELAQKLARACVAQGVLRVVHVSALGASADGPSMYQRSKAAGEAALRDACSQGLRLTVLRPSVIFGADDRFLNLFARLQRMLPVIPLAGAKTRFQPVWVGDVAEALVRCLLNPATVDRVIEACGPDVMTLKQIVQLAGRYASINRGRGRPILELPMGIARLQARLMEWGPGQPLMSRDNLDSMRVDNVASGQDAGLEALGITPTSMSVIAPGYLGRNVRQGELDDWRKAGGR